MSIRSLTEDGDAIAGYIADHARPLDAVETELRRRTNAETGPWAGMQIGHDQALLFTLLTQIVGATNAVEVGTFTGMSSLAIARGLAPGGRLLCCDVSEEWTAIAEAGWEAAGVRDRIDLCIAPALGTLQALPDERTIDLAFVDADKGGYVAYHDEIVRRMRPGGLLLVDNVLWGGRVVGDDASDDTVAIRAYNRHALADDRVEGVILSVGDGVFALRRLP